MSARKRVRGVMERSIRKDFRFPRTAAWRSQRTQGATFPAGNPASQVPGVNLFGYFTRWLGLGECARLFARAMLDQGCAVSLHDVNIEIPHAHLDHTLDAHLQHHKQPPFACDLIFVNPDHWANALQSIDAHGARNRYVIGYWFWELEQFPEVWRPALDHVDEIMVSSAHVERAMRRICDKPVTRISIPVMPATDSGLKRCDFGLRDENFIFLCSFDFNSTTARKNPQGAIEAFCRAFPRGDEAVCLVIKSSNGDRCFNELLRLVQLAACDTRIVIHDDMLEREDLQALLRCCDAYVSLHRCEGFGLGLAEAMCQGKPVIGTAYSGNMEFMNEHNSCLVDYHMIPVQAVEYPYAEGQRWADPDAAHAARHMARLYRDREWGRRLGAQAEQDIRRGFSAQVCVRQLALRLERIARETCHIA